MVMAEDNGPPPSAAADTSEHQSRLVPPTASQRATTEATASRGSREFVKSLVAKGGGAREFTSPRFKNSSRFNPIPHMPADVDPLLVTSHEDMGERASFHSSMYHTVRASPQRYAVAFKSKCERFGDDRGSFLHLVSSPGYLEHQETPRAAPSINHAMNRPATSINGADNERSYSTTFRSKYAWPKNIELPINGGEYDSAQPTKTVKTYGSTFKTALKDHTIRKQARMDFRSPEYDTAHPTTVVSRQAASLMNYSAMTVKSSKERFTIPTYATGDIRDWYDIARGAIPDLAVAVERSPIKYSAFHATSTHPHNVGKELPASQRPMSVPLEDARDPSYEVLGSTKRVHCPTWNRAARFLPDGHPMSGFPARVCNNESHDSTTGTIARELQTSPVRVKTMSTRTSRTSAVDLCYNPRPGSRLYVTRSKTEWYEDAGKALPDGRMPIADRVASTPQTYSSVLQSQSMRSEFPVSLDPRQTFEHERRRQHILESRIQALRESGKMQLSAKMAKILNIQHAPTFTQSTMTHEEQRESLLQQSRDLHKWLEGPGTGPPARVRSIASERSASVAPSTTRSSGSRSSKATVGKDKSCKGVFGDDNVKIADEKVGKVREEKGGNVPT